MTSDSKTRLIGNDENFWLWTAEGGFDLTHHHKPESEPVEPRLKFFTETSAITIAPQKTALIIIDMQNFFLHEPLRPRGPGHDAKETLLKYGIPAALKADIQIIWLTWGCTEEDLAYLSPTTVRSFAQNGDGIWNGGISHDIGPVKLANGEFVQGGKMLMRDQWNTELHGPLAEAFAQGVKQSSVPDVRFHKNRISGMCDAMKDCSKFLKKNKIKTLLFTGVNTDQCVLGTLQDANLKGFDTLLMKDGCGTNTGEFAQKATEINCDRSWGFVASCKALYEAAMDIGMKAEDTPIDDQDDSCTDDQDDLRTDDQDDSRMAETELSIMEERSLTFE